MIHSCSESILQYLSNAVNVRITDRNGDTSLHIAVRRCRSKEVILALLDSRHGAEAASIPNRHGMTALHMAVSTTYSDEFVRVLSQVINVNAQDRDGKTALHYAVEEKQIAFLNILLYEQKADPSIQDYEGNTPLSLACELPMENHLSHIFLLYQYGVAYGENMV